MKAVAMLAALVLATPAAAQNTVAPGSSVLHPEELRARVDTLEVLAVRGADEIPAGLLVLRTELVDAGGRSTLLRVEQMTVRGAVVSVDSFTVDRRTLAPIHVAVRDEDGARELRFAEGRVRSSGAGKPVDTRLPGPVFYANAVDLVLGALPLSEGYDARLAVFETESGESRVRVAGAEEIGTGDGGRCPAWRVEVVGAGHGGTYWIGRDTRSLVRYDANTGFRIVRRSGCAAAPTSTRVTRR